MIKNIDRRTKFIFNTILAILLILILFYIQFTYMENLRLTGKPISGGSSSGGSSGGGGPTSGGSSGGGGGGISDPYCGDQKINQDSEECDDGGTGSSTCTRDCKLTYCGDGIKQSPNGKKQGGKNNDGYEECDDGNTNNTDSCIIDKSGKLCVIAYCGDGYVQVSNEECDDGNLIEDDICSNSCKLNIQGGIQQPTTPQCSDGIDNDGDGLTDQLDEGCWENENDPFTYNPDDNSETGETPQCQNGKDDDGDGFIDLADPDCTNADDISEFEGDAGGKGGSDADQDEIPDDEDNCPNVNNPDQKDSDGDGIGDACDQDNGDNGNNKDGQNNNVGGGDQNSASLGNKNVLSGGHITYLIKNGEEFTSGEYTQIILKESDEVRLYLNGNLNLLRIISVSSDFIEIEITTNSGKVANVISLGEIKEIKLENKIIAIKLDQITDGSAYTTIVSLGETSSEDLGKSIEQVFEESLANEQNKVDSTSSFVGSQILYIIIAIILILVIIAVILITKLRRKNN